MHCGYFQNLPIRISDRVEKDVNQQQNQDITPLLQDVQNLKKNQVVILTIDLTLANKCIMLLKIPFN